jgi:hypothetical protein
MVRHNDGKNSTVTEHEEWSQLLAIDAQAASRDEEGRCRIALSLAAPADAPVSDPVGEVSWRLVFTVQRPGFDIRHVFEVPVFDDGSGSGLQRADLAGDEAGPLERLAEAGIAVEALPAGFVVSLPAPRNPGLAMSASVIGGIFAWGAVVAQAAEAGTWIWAGLAGIAILILRGALRSWCWRSRITVDGATLRVTAGWWRLRSDERPLSACAGVEIKTTMSANNVAFYNAWLACRDGSRIALARGLRQREASTLQRLLEEALESA